MKNLLRTMMGLPVAAFVLVGMSTIPAMAQDKAKAAKAETGKATSTVLAENEKVRVLENRLRPGDVNEAPPSPFMRVVRVLKGGTFLRTYADGKTEKIEWKTGETSIVAPSAQPYTTKNVGKTEIVLYRVVLK